MNQTWDLHTCICW